MNLRRLIINADDFGRSPAINQAVICAHHEGVLTSASLMVNEPAFEDAVAIARKNPRLGVGLHLTLLCGHSTLPQEKISRLVNSSREFSNKPTSTGVRYFFSRLAESQLNEEIAAQFEKFHATGLKLDHVNGHLNIHLHPKVLKILLDNAGRWRIKALRLTSEPFFLNCRISMGNWFYRVSHAIIFRLLSSRARPLLAGKNIRHTENVFGLLQNSRVDENYILNLLRQLPSGNSELYSHPSLDEFRPEFEALVSPRVRSLVKELAIQLIRYQDL
jgi:chitin disaccharide deacetylase